ncbi:MAG: hypothetical protein ACYSRZ_09175 [Planctomycetota bacterium]|jgi:hypothetical protein
MAEKTNNLDLDSLRDEIRDRVKIFSEKVMSAFGDNLQNITIVGSSLTEKVLIHSIRWHVWQGR